MKRTVLFFCGIAGVALMTAGCVEHRVVYVPAQQPPSYAPPPGQPTGGAPPPDQAAMAAPAPSSEVVVAQAPPTPIVETIPVSPGPAYVWTPGYWYWGGGRWVWYRGAYVVRPHSHAVWVGPRYVRRGGGYVWVRGYWR